MSKKGMIFAPRKGNCGVQLGFSNGDKFLLGSQKPEELAEAMNLALGKR